MTKDKILFIDTETGGIDPDQHSLFSIGLVVWSNFQILDSCEILLKEDYLVAEPEALAINKIDLKKHIEDAYDHKTAFSHLEVFLKANFDLRNPIVLGGHNVTFDVGFLKVFLQKQNIKFEKLFSHRFVDTASILYYLYLAGKLKTKTISSDLAFNLFNIKVHQRHTALADAIATAELFSELIKMLKSVRRKKVPDDSQISLFE